MELRHLRYFVAGGHRYFLGLGRHDDGSWDWYSHWLVNDRDRVIVSPLLAS